MANILKCIDYRENEIANNTKWHETKKYFTENSNDEILNDCSTNGGPSVPFDKENNFINRTIQRPKTYKNIQFDIDDNIVKIRMKKNKRVLKNKNLEINYCVFCYNNKEPEENYKSHIVRNQYGIVTCPKLRLYECPICFETGDNAHTIKYCPKKKIVTLEETLIMETQRRTKKKFNENSIYA